MADDLPASADDLPPNLPTELQAGNRTALATLFDRRRMLLERIVGTRLHPRLCGRLDVDDALQEVYLQAEQRLGHFNGVTHDEAIGWLVLVAKQTVIDIHRRHITAQARDLRRELRPGHAASDREAQSSAWLFGSAGLTSPSQAMQRNELQQRIHAALDKLSDNDREILWLRHFVESSNSEAAEILGLTPQAASVRYIRALERLKQVCGPLWGPTSSSTM